MKLLVFGATGSIGCQVVEQALEQGHIVSAFARHPLSLTFGTLTSSWRRGMC